MTPVFLLLNNLSESLYNELDAINTLVAIAEADLEAELEN